MFGCCGSEERKFRNQDGSVDKARLDALVAELRTRRYSDEQLRQVEMCDCGCHVDGQCVMC